MVLLMNNFFVSQNLTDKLAQIALQTIGTYYGQSNGQYLDLNQSFWVWKAC